MPGLRIPQGGGFWQRGQQHAQGAMGGRSRMHPDRETELNAPGKTAGGGLMASAGMAAGGYAVGSAMASSGAVGSAGGPWGAAIGAGVGLVAYLLS
jgi:hypothetical protein